LFPRGVDLIAAVRVGVVIVRVLTGVMIAVVSVSFGVGAAGTVCIDDSFSLRAPFITNRSSAAIALLECTFSKH
jgi:hypothetical protein